MDSGTRPTGQVACCHTDNAGGYAKSACRYASKRIGGLALRGTVRLCDQCAGKRATVSCRSIYEGVPMRRRLTILCGLLSAVLSAGFCLSPAYAEKRVALVIGNGAYRNVAGLPNPPNDAGDI